MYLFISARGTSTLSLFSTTAEENQTLKSVSALMEEEPRTEDESMQVEGVDHNAPPSTGEADMSMEVDLVDVVDVVDEAEVDASLTKPSPMPLEDKDVISPNNIIKEENGKIIVEKLDSPAIRKERAQRRKKEKRLAEAAAQQTLARPGAGLNMDLSSAFPTAGPSRLPDEGPSEDMDVEIEGASELSELSEAGSQDVRGRAPRSKPPERTRVQPSRAKRSRAGVREPGAVVLAENAMLESGTLGMS
jgi:NuA3 HAT complex component NTO1